VVSAHVDPSRVRSTYKQVKMTERILFQGKLGPVYLATSLSDQNDLFAVKFIDRKRIKDKQQLNEV